MKKLMFAALAAVAVGAAYADAAKGKAYVYQVYMDIKTTQSDYCFNAPEQYIECGYNEGSNSLVRVLDDYTIKGYIYRCDDLCSHLYDATQELPLTYTNSISRTANPRGIILWETRKQAKVAPIEGAKWNDGVTPVLKYRFLNVNNVAFDRCEGVFDFKANLILKTVGGGEVTNTFNMVGAGFGLYQTVAAGKSVWTRQTGLMAGTMTAPWMFDEDGLVIEDSQSYGFVCGAACGGATSTYSNLTAANGTYTISYNDQVAQDFGTAYCAALYPYIPAYADWK